MRAPLLHFFLQLGSLAVVLAHSDPTFVTRNVQIPKTLNPSISRESLNGAAMLAIPQSKIFPMTNARRFASGFPPLPPKNLKRATETAMARRESPSSVPPPSQAHIEIREVGTDKSLGFIGRVYNAFGEAGVTTDPDMRMVFALPASSGPMSLTTINGPDSKYPVLGGVKGYSSTDSNMGPSSSNYATFGSTVETSSNSPPVMGGSTFSEATDLPEFVESAIWTYSPVNGVITPQWVNADSLKPRSYPGYTDGFLILTGDKTAFASTYGSTTWVSFTVLPIRL